MAILTESETRVLERSLTGRAAPEYGVSAQVRYIASYFIQTRTCLGPAACMCDLSPASDRRLTCELTFNSLGVAELV